MTALAKVNGIKLEPWETINAAKAAENKYVGVNCGKLDQSCEVLCKKDELLYLDCKDESFELIPKNPAMKPFRIAVFFSGLERSLANSAYNLRQDECKAAAYNLLAYAGMEYGKFADTRLRDVPYEVFNKYGDRLPENFKKEPDIIFRKSIGLSRVPKLGEREILMHMEISSSAPARAVLRIMSADALS